MRLGYKDLGLELISLWEYHSHHPKRNPMVDEKKRDGEIGHPIRLFLKEPLT
jgi:hypothetical protein